MGTSEASSSFFPLEGHNISQDDRKRIHIELQRSVQQLSTRGLKLSTRWAAELAVAIDLGEAPAAPSTTHESTVVMDDVYVLAKSHFDCGEYRRAAHTLESSKLHVFSNTHYFLWGYSLYLSGEHEKQSQETIELDAEVAVNPELKRLHDDLLPRYEAHQLDGFGLYLFGIVLKNLKHVHELPHLLDDIELPKIYSAKSVLLESVQIYPWNWSAWLDLASCCAPNDDIESLFLSIPSDWMFEFFRAHVSVEHQHFEVAMAILGRLTTLFPQSSYIIAQRALAHYNLRDFDSAQTEFQTVTKLDPYRLDNLDVFSNVLYVKESKAELSRLAHSAMNINKLRPETCCVVGNYYSLKAKHDRAVVFFRRALRLDPQFLAAWTLIGHEYVELKNTNAAIESYRRAVDINPNDYRAWYGLGQTYEILRMEHYALYYYRKAAALRSFDARMWCAMAGCYRRLDRRDDAVRCYERAISNKDEEGIAAVQMAALCRDSGNHAEAARYFEMHLNQRDNGQPERQETIDAILFLAVYYKTNNRYSEAVELCNRLLDHPGPEKDEARALLRELRNLERVN